MEQKEVFEYFYIENSVSEWNFDITGRYTSFNAAREALKEKCDWYSSKDTGRIYRCTVYEEDKKLTFKKTLVFTRSQHDAIQGLPGTYHKS